MTTHALVGAAIVLAEDDAVMRDYVSGLLAERGVEVIAVGDGQAALEMIRARRPDLALVDVVMPKLNGFALLDALRSDEDLKTLPVIILSAHDDADARIEGFAAGADDYLIKPFSERELLARVGAHLQLVRMRKQAEQQLRDNEERLRMALRAARMVAWEWDATSERLISTENIAEIAGLQSGSRIEWLEHGLALIHPDDVESHRRELRRALGDGQSHVTEFRLIRQDTAEILWMEAHFKAVEDESKGPRLVGVARDITDRRRAEAERKRLNERLEAELVDMQRLQEASAHLIQEGEIDGLLVEILRAAIAVTRADMGLLQLLDSDTGTLRVVASRGVDPSLVNFLDGQAVAATSIYGASLRTCERLVVPDADDSELMRADQACADAHRKARANAVQSTPLISRPGRPVGVLSSHWHEPHEPAERELRLLDLLARQAADVIERHQAMTTLRDNEQKLRELSRSLEERVLERTAELERQTVQLRGLAAELTATEQRERKRLAALLHDDLQQLLVAAGLQLRECSRLLTDGAAKEALQRCWHLIRRAVDSARDLSCELRPPVLYEAGLVPALHWLGTQMSERQRLRVIVDGDESVPSRLSEDGKALLFECCRELLFNVTKYAGTDTATVQVREDEHCLRLVVLDRGRGFDVSQLGKLRKTGGFGLFSIRERVVALGGEVTVNSDIGAGTRIELKLPILPAVDDESRQQPQWDVEATVRQSTPGTGDRRTRVVVVDDHAIVRQGMVHILSRHEQIAVVGEAADGIAAIEAVQQHLPDVVVLDVNMPRMNGIEAAREIRRRWPEITIVALSVQSDEATARSMLESGAVACLSKSSDAEALISTIVTRQPLSHNAR